MFWRSMKIAVVAAAAALWFAVSPAGAATECHDLGGEGTLCITTPDDPAAGDGAAIGVRLNAGVSLCIVVFESCP